MDAASATLWGKHVVALRRRGTQGTVSDVVRVSAETGQAVVLSQDQFEYLDGSQDTLVAVNLDTGSVLVRASSGRAWSLTGQAQSYPQFPEAALGFAVWNDQSGSFLLDTKSGRLVRLSTVELNLQAYANGRFVVWTSRETAEHLGVQSVGRLVDS